MVVRDIRRRAYGQDYAPTAADRLGVWLSARRIRRVVGSFSGKTLADIGCGYHASFVRSVLAEVASATVVDLAVAADLKEDMKIVAVQGALPDVLRPLADRSFDVVVCNSVVEHLWEPLEMLSELRRLVSSGGICLVNVPSWRGKRFLEVSAFRLGLSPREEMDDHKTYYDPSDLWPLLVRAGFVPHNIRCYRHKLGLNTFAECRVDPDSMRRSEAT